MLGLPTHHQNELAHARETVVSPDEVVVCGPEGVAIGIKELQDALLVASSRFQGPGGGTARRALRSVGQGVDGGVCGVTAIGRLTVSRHTLMTLSSK